jgi:cell wall assembly regulator SMI1
MATSISESWDIIHNTLREHCPELFDALARPATKRQVATLQKKIGKPLPADLVESLRIHNGMEDSYLGTNRLFNYEALLSTDAMATQWGTMTRMLQDGFFDDGGCPLTRTRKIRNDRWWNALWIPITDADGDGYCLDLDPASRGTAGQVFYFYHDGARTREVVAKSYAEWLATIGGKMARGQFHVDDGSIWLDSM